MAADAAAARDRTPISIAFLIEYGISSSAVLLMGVIGTSALAAHQITSQVAAILFMIPSGISTVVTMRVAHAVGRHDHPGIARAGVATMVLALVVVAMLTAIVITLRVGIAKFFLGERVDDTDATIKLSAHLLLVGRSLFIAFALYAIASGSLRGLRDTQYRFCLPASHTGRSVLAQLCTRFEHRSRGHRHLD